MKKIIFLALVAVMLLACVSFTACGGGAPPSGEGAESGDGTTAPPSSDGDGFTWNDAPTYPGASQIARGSWAIPPEEGEWQRAEWRHYETGDSQSTVVAFYQSAMAQNGWQQMMEMEIEEISWFWYTKNNEQDGAMVWIGKDNGNTIISIMRGGQ